MIDCIVHDVPFPAYETFEDRQNLPRRFFLFFDKIFKAGRHNKCLWNAAIERNKGRNNISFGTCIFEAHVRTIIQENYFTWMYQALASPKIIQVLEKADDFKTEYDPKTVNSFTFSHKVGLKLEEELELLKLESEEERSIFLIKHFKRMIPVMKAIEQAKEKIKQNGHFKHLDPLNF